MRVRSLRVGIVMVIFLLTVASSPVVGQSVGQGYSSRSCGLDMDRDGTVGEPAEDCDVCDGVTTDPDRDGVDEDLNYVDAASGTDNLTCGDPTTPCRTIGWVLAGNNSDFGKRVDGASADPEDIVCIKGTHVLSSPLVLSVDGAAGSYAAALYPGDAPEWGSGNNSLFRYPSDPFMIVGWDADNDGAYPPYDVDDRAILDGDQGAGLFSDAAFRNDASYLELAHFTIANFGRENRSESGYAGFLQLTDGDSHLYLHDLEFEAVLKNARHSSGHVLVSMFSAEGLEWFAFVNNRMTDMAGYGFRGSCGNAGVGWCRDIRVDFNTVTAHALKSSDTPQPGFTWYRPWGNMDRVSVSWNDVDCDPDQWTPGEDSGSGGIIASICVQDFRARGNRITDCAQGLYVRLTYSAGECSSKRPTTILWDRNHVSNSFGTYVNDYLMYSEPSNSDDIYLGDSTVSNNMLVAEAPNVRAAMSLNGGQDDADPGSTWNIVNNTAYGTFDYAAFLFAGADTYNADVIFKNNIVAGATSGDNVRWLHDKGEVWAADHNVYDPDAGWRWHTTSHSTLPDWQTASSGDANSVDCSPLLAGPTDPHLLPADTCARDKGVDMSGITGRDYDGDARPRGAAWDIGADETESAGGDPVPPEAPTNLRVK